MTASENPYIAPVTPSDQIWLEAEAFDFSAVDAYRVGYVFYCRPDFESPLVCYKTGVEVDGNHKPTTLKAGAQSVELYISGNRNGSTNWGKVFKMVTLFLFLFATILMAVFLSNILFVVPSTLLLIVALIPAKNHGVEMQYLDTGFIRVLDGHSDFLRLFPDPLKTTEELGS